MENYYVRVRRSQIFGLMNIFIVLIFTTLFLILFSWIVGMHYFNIKYMDEGMWWLFALSLILATIAVTLTGVFALLNYTFAKWARKP